MIVKVYIAIVEQGHTGSNYAGLEWMGVATDQWMGQVFGCHEHLQSMVSSSGVGGGSQQWVGGWV